MKELSHLLVMILTSTSSLVSRPKLWSSNSWYHISYRTRTKVWNIFIYPKSSKTLCAKRSVRMSTSSYTFSCTSCSNILII